MLTSRQLGRLVVPALVATAVHTLVVAAPAAAPSTAKPAHRTAVTTAARPTAPAVVPKSPVTISLTSRMRHGNLVVLLDGVPVFNEEFQKPIFIISQTTTWDPLQVSAGTHKLTAKVYGAKGQTYLSGVYEIVVSRTDGIELHIRMKGDKLTVEPAS